MGNVKESNLESTLNREIPAWLRGKEEIMESGISSGRGIRKIAREIGVSQRYISDYLDEREKREVWKKAHERSYRENYKNRTFPSLKGKERIVIKMAERGRSLSVIAEVAKVSKPTIRDFLVYSSLYTKRVKRRRYSEIDRLATSENPPTLDAMMKMVDNWNTIESPRQYLISKDIHKIWKQKRNEPSVKKALIGDIAQTVLEYAAAKEDPYMGRVIREGIQKGPGLRSDLTSIKRAANVLRARDELIARGEKLNLSKIGRAAGGVDYEVVGSILRRARVDVKKVTNKRIPLSKSMKKASIRSLSLDMSDTDKAYFLRVPEYIPQGYRAYHTKKGDKKFKVRKSYGVHLRIASQIYEVYDFYEDQDLDFSNEEIEETAELVAVSENVVKMRIKERPELEPKILHALRVIYRKRKYKVPYLTSEDKVK